MAENTDKGQAWTVNPSAHGVTGLRRSGGFIDEEFNPALRGLQGNRVYREMADNDPAVGAMLFAVTALCGQVEWQVQAADGGEEATEAKEFVEGVMDDMEHSWTDFVAEAMTMLIYGFAPMEMVWRRRKGFSRSKPNESSQHDDGKWGLRKIELRAQYSVQEWTFDKDDVLTGFHQTPDVGRQAWVPMGSCMLFRTTSNGNNPEGRSMLRNAYRPWFFKKRIEELEGIGVERDLAGLPVIRVPGKWFQENATAAERASLATYRNVAKAIRRDDHHGLVLPSDTDDKGNKIYDIELLSTGGARQFDTTSIIDRYDRRIVMTLLADFLMLGQTGVGSFALSSDKTEIFATAIGNFLGRIKEEVNRKLVGQLWLFNGLKDDVKPTIMHGDIEKPDLEKLAAYIGSLAGVGMPLFPDPDLENHLREAGGLPPAPEEGIQAEALEDPWPANIPPGKGADYGTGKGAGGRSDDGTGDPQGRDRGGAPSGGAAGDERREAADAGAD